MADIIAKTKAALRRDIFINGEFVSTPSTFEVSE
jgi:hypothetical protein